MANYTYNANEASCTFNGIVIKFQSIAISKENDKNIITEGTTGEVVRSVQSDKIGEIAITVQKATAQNALLAAAAALNTTGAVMVKSGSSLFLMPEGALMKDPDITFETEDGEITWTYKGAFATYLPAGV